MSDMDYLADAISHDLPTKRPPMQQSWHPDHNMPASEHDGSILPTDYSNGELKEPERPSKSSFPSPWNKTGSK